MTQTVLFEEAQCADEAFIGIATLNNPKALNALNLDMVELLLAQFSKWHADDKIAMVILHSDLEKAFCAGGDVVSMYNEMKRKNPTGRFNPSASEKDIPTPVQSFFELEYRLDYLIHTYSKPVVVWGNGIIMGGGLGLFSGASHRIVTPNSRIAMPEVSIGLYPDVGGSWFLNKMPNGCGLFLGMTGASVFAADAIYLNLADHLIENDNKTLILDSILAAQWNVTNQNNHDKLTELCKRFSSSVNNKDSHIASQQGLITKLANSESVQDYCNALISMDVQGDSWLSKAQGSLKYGSPITLNLVFQQLVRGKSLSLADCFKMELIMSCRCASFGEFQEGVRALLVDKDRQPKWWAGSPEKVTDDIIEYFFCSPWVNSQHPLVNL